MGNLNVSERQAKINEIVELIQMYSEKEGLSYKEGLEKVKEQLSSKNTTYEVPVHKYSSILKK